MSSECQAQLFRGGATAEEFEEKLLRFPLVKYHSGSRIYVGLEVSEAGERPTRRTIQTQVLDTIFVAKRSHPF